MGFSALAHVGKAVSIFGSARTPPGAPGVRPGARGRPAAGRGGLRDHHRRGPGIMEAANRGASEAGVSSIGLDIELPHEQAYNEFVDLGLTFHYFFTRKVMFVRYASAFVVFPGGFGTLDELFEAATLRQTRKIRHFPILLVGSSYWQGLVDWLSGPVLEGGKIDPHDVERLHVTDDLDEVVAICDAADHRTPRAACASGATPALSRTHWPSRRPRVRRSRPSGPQRKTALSSSVPGRSMTCTSSSSPGSVPPCSAA